MQLWCVGSVVLMVAAPLVQASAQAHSGPTLAAGLARGRQSDRTYSTTSWSGFHVALTLPVYRTRRGAAVVDVTRDVFWNGNGDDCVLRPPTPTCVPDPPSVTGMTIGWLHVPGPSHSLYLGVGRLAGRGHAKGGGMARLQFDAGGSHLGIQAFGQYTLVPSFHRVTYQTVLAGLNVYLR